MKGHTTLGENLKHFMGNMSPAELHRITGVPAMTIGRILKDEVNPQIDTLERLAKGLDIPVSALVSNDEVLKKIILKLASMPLDELNAVKTILKL